MADPVPLWKQEQERVAAVAAIAPHECEPSPYVRDLEAKVAAIGAENMRLATKLRAIGAENARLINEANAKIRVCCQTPVEAEHKLWCMFYPAPVDIDAEKARRRTAAQPRPEPQISYADDRTAQTHFGPETDAEFAERHPVTGSPVLDLPSAMPDRTSPYVRDLEFADRHPVTGSPALDLPPIIDAEKARRRTADADAARAYIVGRRRAETEEAFHRRMVKTHFAALNDPDPCPQCSASPYVPVDVDWATALVLATTVFAGVTGAVVVPNQRRDFVETATWFYVNLRIPPGEGDGG